MRFKLVVQTIVVLLFVNIAANAKNSRQFFLRTSASMNGAEVPVGIYDLTWESHNSKVIVTLWKDGRFFATAQGSWVKNGARFPSDAALLRVNADGSRSLVEIRIAGIKKAIVLENTVESNIAPVLRVGSR